MNLMLELVIEMSSCSCLHNMLDFATCDSCRIHPLESHSEVSCPNFVMAWEIAMVGNVEGNILILIIWRMMNLKILTY